MITMPDLVSLATMIEVYRLQVWRIFGRWISCTRHWPY